MITLVIPDIHNRIEIVDYILNNVTFDRCIFLGDFFDSWKDSPIEARKTATWMKKILSSDKFQAIHGNHDFAYWQPNWGYAWCPGFSSEKSNIINSIITPDLWEKKFNFVWFEQGWVLSHAGFHREALPIFPDLDQIDQYYLARASDQALDNVLRSRPHPILEKGEAMGEFGRSGCLWLRWDEFEPISDINQIVGHTMNINYLTKRIDNKVREFYLDENGKTYNQDHQQKNVIKPISSNFNLDTQNNYYGIIEDSKFSYVEIATGKKIIPNQ